MCLCLKYKLIDLKLFPISHVYILENTALTDNLREYFCTICFILQCAHGALGAAEKAMMKDSETLYAWKACGQPKVVVKTDSEQSL
jgi:hypothetical protein